MNDPPPPTAGQKPAAVPARSIVLVGLMGAGKSTVGRKLASRLDLPFTDTDLEIEAAYGCAIEDIFAREGEAAFRAAERQVMARLLDGPAQVLATGGGAFMDPETRARVRARGISIWLRADLDVLLRRCLRRNNRPLLKTADPRAVMERLIAERYPVYAGTDIVIESNEQSQDQVVERIMAALEQRVTAAKGQATADGETAEGIATVEVGLGARAYRILAGEGLLAAAGQHIAPLLARPRTVIVTDGHVAAAHLAALEAALDRAGIAHDAIVLPPGEGTKSFAELAALIDRLLALRVERRDTILAFGGGVIGDLAGFAAAVLHRGIAFIQVPTTLLAQVDSAVGGKTGINVAAGKNLVGSFHQPRLVLSDVGLLDTLPRRQLLAGYAEVAKYGLIDDPGFFAWLETEGAALIAGDPAARCRAVAHCCRAKAAIVGRDEREGGERALLNLGHTFGHALEAEAGFSDRLLHGEAVAIGCVLAFALSARLGLCPAADVARLRRHFQAVGLPVDAAGIAGPEAVERLWQHMLKDKKVADGRPTFVLARGIGQAFLSREVAYDDFAAMWRAERAA